MSVEEFKYGVPDDVKTYLDERFVDDGYKMSMWQMNMRLHIRKAS